VTVRCADGPRCTVLCASPKDWEDATKQNCRRRGEESRELEEDEIDQSQSGGVRKVMQEDAGDGDRSMWWCRCSRVQVAG
jgi:hypothetical protein